MAPGTGRDDGEEEGQAGRWFALAEQDASRPSPPSPEEGRRLVAAFMAIKNATLRDAIINLVERMSPTFKDLG